jgi:hypothetical protein
MYPVFGERTFVSFSLIMYFWLMLCSATADLSVCVGRMSIVFLDSNLNRATDLSNIYLATLTSHAVHIRHF